jgi:membrane protein DedA with SNARE-associated domain
VPLWQALLVMEVAALLGASLLGASFLYLLTARAGRGLVYRHGRYMHLTPERLDRAERWLSRGVYRHRPGAGPASASPP